MTLLKLLALIRIYGTSKTELGRSRFASRSHDNCVPENPWARSCLWAPPEAAQQKMQLVRDAPEGCHPERDVRPSEGPDPRAELLWPEGKTFSGSVFAQHAF